MQVRENMQEAVDISNSDIDLAATAIAEWLEETGGLWMDWIS